MCSNGDFGFLTSALNQHRESKIIEIYSQLKGQLTSRPELVLKRASACLCPAASSLGEGRAVCNGPAVNPTFAEVFKGIYERRRLVCVIVSVLSEAFL